MVLKEVWTQSLMVVKRAADVTTNLIITHPLFPVLVLTIPRPCEVVLR